MITNLTQKYNIQSLDISPDWKIVRNVFLDIDPKDNIPEEDKLDNIYCQEDLLYMTKNNYHLDLGWYGYTLVNDKTGYCINLFRGENWNNGELLEKFRSKEKQVIVAKINELINAVDTGYFDNLTGYIVNENDPTNNNDFSKVDTYSAKQKA